VQHAAAGPLLSRKIGVCAGASCGAPLHHGCGLLSHDPAPTAARPAELELVRRFTLRQEGAAACEPLFVAAPTERSRGSLEPLRPARRLVVAEDVGAADEALVARAHAEEPALQLYPHAMPPDRGNRLLQMEVGRFRDGRLRDPVGRASVRACCLHSGACVREARRSTRTC
jgi:hypothetical protein